MENTLENKLALVTGASRGIGQAIARALGKQGATVIGTSTTASGADGITQTFAADGIQGQGLVLDVCDSGSIPELLKSVARDYAAPVILVNNAAVNRDNLLLRMKEEDWASIIDTNLTSVYRLSKACLRGMMKARYGRIINISSIVGLTGNPGQSNYAAAKAGVIGFAKSLAHEIGSRGITVNNVAPGFIDTDMTRALNEEQRNTLLKQIPLERLGTAEEVAHAVSFLASPLAGYITGETLNINGGMYMP